MTLLELVFELVHKYVPMKEEKWAKLKSDAEMDVREWHPEHENKLKALYAKLNSKWYTQLTIAALFIPLSMSIAKYIAKARNVVEGVDDDEEEDDF